MKVRFLFAVAILALAGFVFMPTPTVQAAAGLEIGATV